MTRANVKRRSLQFGLRAALAATAGFGVVFASLSSATSALMVCALGLVLLVAGFSGLIASVFQSVESISESQDRLIESGILLGMAMLVLGGACAVAYLSVALA